MNEGLVDLGPITLEDAYAVQIALQVAVDSGYFARPENYAAVMQVKALLNYRIALAESFSNPRAFVEDAR